MMTLAQLYQENNRLAAHCDQLERELAQLRQEQDRLRKSEARPQLLSTNTSWSVATAQVANLLLRSPDYTTVLPDVVRLLGEAVGSDRCIITHNLELEEDSGKVAVKFLRSWFRSENLTIGMIGSDPESVLLIEDDWQEFYQQFVRGETANFIVAELPEPMRSFFEAHRATSMLLVPIFVQGQLWGQIGFDNCGEPRLYDEAEISIVKIAADSIAAAIERQAKDEELRKSEALYRSLFEISNEGIYRWQLDQPVSIELPVDEQVELVYCYHCFAQGNDALAKMYGFAKAEDIVGLRLADVHPPESKLTLEMMRAICGNGWQIRNAESEEIDANGQKRYYLNSIISFVENGFVSSGWGTQIDITELREAQQALLEAEQARSHLLTTVTTIANQLLRSSDYSTVLPTVLQLLGEAAQADRCSLVQNITDPHTGKPAVKLHTEWCRSGIQPSIVHTPALETALLWEDFPEVQARLSRNEPISFEIAELAEPARSLLLDQGNLTMSMVPIMVEDEFWGVFGFDYCTEDRSLNDEETEIYAIAVDSIAAAVERQRSQQALLKAEQNRAAELVKANDALKRSLDALATDPDLNQFIGHVLEIVAEQLSAPVTEYWSVTENVARLELSCWQGEIISQERLPYDPRIQGIEIPPEMVADEPLTNRQRHFVVNDLPNDPVHIRVFSPLDFDLKAWCSRHRVSRLLNVPLQLGDQSIGALVIYQPIDRHFTDQQIELAYALAQQVTLAIQLTRLAEAAKQAAIAQEQEKAAQERAVELAKANDALKRSLNILATEPDLDKFLGQVLKEVILQVQGYSGHIFLYDETENTLNTRCSVVEGQIYHGISPFDPALFRSPFNADITPVFRYLCEQRAIWSLNTGENFDEFIWAETIEWHRQRGHREAIALALMAGDRPVGLLGLTFRDRTTLKPEELELVHALAQQATLAIQLTHLAQQAQHSAILAERNRMARDIHDTLAQGLTGIIVHLEGAENVLSEDPDKARSRLDRARQLARESLTEARRSVHALRPQSLESADLCTAIKQLIQQMTEDTPLHVQFECEALPDRLSPNLESHLLRITQEALTNIIKHAAATQVRITFSVTSDILQLSIHDDGQGFEVDSNLGLPQSTTGFGLIGMRDRVHQLQGQFSLTSQPGRGTAIDVMISNPFANEE